MPGFLLFLPFMVDSNDGRQEGETEEASSSDNRQVTLDVAEKVIPTGYRFQPNEDELVFVYLANKTTGKLLPTDAIQDIRASYFYMDHPKKLGNFIFLLLFIWL